MASTPCWAGAGLKITRFYFYKELDTGDNSREQVMKLLEDKLNTISSDLKLSDLNLANVGSAFFTFKLGISAFEADDLDDAITNFKSAEKNAVAALSSTAPSKVLKLFSLKIAICAVIWLQEVLFLRRDANFNGDHVAKEISSHINTLLSDSRVEKCIKTHLKWNANAILAHFNHEKRFKLIADVVEIENHAREVIFGLFLEVLPVSIFPLNKGKSVYLLNNPEQDISDFPQQSLVVAAIKAWKDVSPGANKTLPPGSEIIHTKVKPEALGEVKYTEETSIATTGVDDRVVYIKQSKVIDRSFRIKEHHQLQLNLGSIHPVNDTILNKKGDMNALEIVFICIKVQCSNKLKRPPLLSLFLHEDDTFLRSNFAIQTKRGREKDFYMLFYGESELVKELNQNSSEIKLVVCSEKYKLDIATIKITAHFKYI